VVDVGDLSVFSAHETWNANGKTIDATTVEMNDIVNLEELSKKLK